MKKKTRIGLMALITVILLLALATPGLAEKPTAPVDCTLKFPVTNNSGNTITSQSLPGELTIDGWTDDTLINTCVGEVPFGDPVDHKGPFTWFEYDDLISLTGWQWSEDVAIVTSDISDIWVTVWDEDSSYKSTFWKVEIYPEGTFIFTREYTP